MKFVSAPIAGYTDPSFRLLLSELPYDRIYSEMVATKGITYNNKQTFSMLTDHGEKNLVTQIFGNDPVDFVNTCRVIRENGLPERVDINAGCSIKKIVRSDFGVKLLEQPDAVRRIVLMVKERFPGMAVTLKTRLGFVKGDGLLERFLEKIADLPLDSITVHGRYASQIFSGLSDWNKIDQIAKISPFPVYGNGDIFTYQDFLERKVYMGRLEGIMLGRGVLRNPFLIGEIIEKTCPDTCFEESVQLKKTRFLLELLELRRKLFGEDYAVRETRKYYGWILKGFKGASFYRNYFIKEEKYDSIIQTVNKIYDTILHHRGER